MKVMSRESENEEEEEGNLGHKRGEPRRVITLVMKLSNGSSCRESDFQEASTPFFQMLKLDELLERGNNNNNNQIQKEWSSRLLRKGRLRDEESRFQLPPFPLSLSLSSLSSCYLSRRRRSILRGGGGTSATSRWKEESWVANSDLVDTDLDDEMTRLSPFL